MAHSTATPEYPVTNTAYRGSNDAIMGMSDADFFGRQQALGVNIPACYRAACRETAGAAGLIIHGQSTLGALKIRRAVHRLAIAIGNQSEAETWLGRQILVPVNDVMTPTDQRDRDELDRAAAREHGHPTLVATLAEIDAKIEELRNR